MESLGFTNIRIWYQTVNFVIKDADHYLNMTFNNANPLYVLNKLTPEMREIVKNEIKEGYNKWMSENLDPKIF
jgi:hypothetical protein